MKTLKLICLLFFVSSPFLKADPLLTRWLPYDYADEMSYINVTPYELLNTTNADRIFGAEYYSYDELLVEIFATYTKDGASYDLASNVYGRSAGEKILRIEEKEFNSFQFLVSYFEDINGAEKLRICFSLSDLGNEIRLYKQWSKDQIETVHNLYNYEFTFTTEAELSRFMTAMVDKIVDEGDCFQIDNTPCPEVFVKQFKFELGVLSFALNRSVSGEIVINNGIENIGINLNGESLFHVDYDFIIGNNLLSFSTDLGEGEDLFYVDFNEILSAVVEKKEIIELSIFPNPTSDYLTIIRDAQGDFFIVNRLGEICKKGNIYSERDQIDIRDLKPGSYYIMLQQDKELIKGTFVKI